MPNCIYCFEPVKSLDDRDLCAACKDCPDSVRQRVLGQLTLTRELRLDEERIADQMTADELRGITAPDY